MAASRILLVDDDPVFRAALARMLKPHVVIELGAATAALAQIALEPFDLVISDVRMWPMDGAELAADMQRHRHDVPVMFITGADLADVRTMADDLLLRNVVEILAKPVAQHELELAVARAFAARPRRKPPARPVALAHSDGQPGTRP